MKPANYIFTYRSHLDRAKCWQRHFCETKEDIARLTKIICKDYGNVEEVDKELTDEEWLKMKEEYENQEA
jgi:hypothetical protein